MEYCEPLALAFDRKGPGFRFPDLEIMSGDPRVDALASGATRNEGHECKNEERNIRRLIAMVDHVHSIDIAQFDHVCHGLSTIGDRYRQLLTRDRCQRPSFLP